MPGVVMGVDVARFGDVASVIRFRRGRDATSILPIKRRGANTMDRGSPGAIRKETLVMASSRQPPRNRWFVDSPLEGNGFELPVRGRGQPDCRLFVQPASVSSRAHSGGLDIGRRAVQSLVVRTQADRLILHVATACTEDVADIGAAGQVTHTEP